MATPANEGGMGGPSRRQPFRRALSTPYDRPPGALRGARRVGLAVEGGGWISKLVDPAHRLISSGASKLFSTMFRKRLTAPPAAPEEDRQSREDVSQISQIASTIPSSEIQNGDGDNRTSNSERGGIAEVELLLKDKTFTRVESDRLAELLRSRMVDTCSAEHEHNNVKKEKATVQAQEDGIGSSKEHIPRDEAVSPAELAKAYIGSRPSKISPSDGSLRNQIFQEDANLPNLPSTSRRLDLSVAPQSVIRFSGIPEHPEHSYQTARPPGRSAIYRMSRSPYFNVNPMTNIQAGELSRDGYPSPSLSQWTPSVMMSGGKQVLKRGSSDLDGDSPSPGPIRRIRQKSNLMSPFKDARKSFSGTFLSSPSTPVFNDVSKDPMSVQKPFLLDERKYGGTGSQVTENGISNGISNATMFPLKSTETAQKLFQQLDKLLPSPKDRSSEMKTIARDESASKLTLNMLHGGALRSMEDINSSKLFSIQGSGKFDTVSASHLPNIDNSHSQKLDMVEENGRSKAVHLEVKLASEANGVSNAPMPSNEAKPKAKSEYLSASSSVAFPVPKRPAFQMSVPEDFLDLDDDDYNTRDLSGPLTTAKVDADTKMSKRNDFISETEVSGNPPKTSSQSIPISSSISSRRADMTAPIQPVVTEKNNGFAFPVASDPCTHSQPPPTPTMPTPLLDTSDAQKEQTSPLFIFGSKGADSSIFSTAISTATIKVGEGSGSKPILISSATTASTDGSALVKSEIQKAGDTFKSLGNTVSSGISSSAPAVFAFGASTAPSLTNGSLNSSPPTFPVPGTAAVTPSEGPVSSIFRNGAATAFISGSSVSSAAATFSTVPSFQFGSGISTTAPVSVSQPLDKSNSSTMEANYVKASPFSISGSTVQGTSAVFPSSGSSSSSDVATSVAIFGTGISSPALSLSLMSSGVSTSSSAPSSLFSNMAGSSSSVALSSAFPSTGNGVFGFNATTQPAFSSSSFAHCSSQNSASNLLGGTGGSTSSSPLFATSQSSTAGTFSSIGGSIFGTQSSGSIFGSQSSGSIFGTQSSQPGSGASQTTQSSTSQFGSFPSSPSFGSGNSSSGGLGISSFAPATSDAKPFASSSGFSFSGVGSSSASSSSSFAPAAATGLFGLSSQASTTSTFSSSSSSNTSSTGFSFGLSASGSGSSPFTFGSSSAPVFSFTSAGATASPSSSPAPAFGMPSPAVGFGSTANDQMNDDNMTDDTNQSASVLVPTFGQPANQPPSQPFVFGSPAIQSGVLPAFQFGGHQNPSAPQNPSPFQSSGNVEFTGGSFSLGSEGGGDKPGRKFVKIRRDKHRPKK